MKLIKYRDWGTTTFTYFWVDENDKIVGPYFDGKSQAEDWLRSIDKSFTIVDNFDSENKNG